MAGSTNPRKGRPTPRQRPVRPARPQLTAEDVDHLVNASDEELSRYALIGDLEATLEQARAELEAGEKISQATEQARDRLRELIEEPSGWKAFVRDTVAFYRAQPLSAVVLAAAAATVALEVHENRWMRREGLKYFSLRDNLTWMRRRKPQAAAAVVLGLLPTAVRLWDER